MKTLTIFNGTAFFKKKGLISLLIATSCLILPVSVQRVSAQPRLSYIQVLVAPDHPDWNYRVGETATFDVSVLKSNIPMKDVKISYEIMHDRMLPVQSGTMNLAKGRGQLKEKMDKSGFLRCAVTVEYDGRTYTEYATAAFDPFKIKPTTNLPDDFLDFWKSAKEELAEIPVDAKVTLLPEKCTGKVNTYEVNIANITGRVYGILCVPKKNGKYPAMLHVPGAGARPYEGNIDMTERGIITLHIGIQGVPVTMNSEIYGNMLGAAVHNYPTINLDDKDRYYYKRVYLACVRSVDYIFSLPEFDGENIAVYGGSQGGGLSIITAGLDDRIKYLGVFYPALCDLTGFLHNRAGGWPLLFQDDFTRKPDKIETSKYYDAVNFARFITVPGFYSSGYNDRVCPPTSMFSAYNTITAPREFFIVPETAHFTFPEQREKMYDWLAAKLLKQKQEKEE